MTTTLLTSLLMGIGFGIGVSIWQAVETTMKPHVTWFYYRVTGRYIKLGKYKK